MALPKPNTDLARKFGAHVGGKGKSWLTPLDARFPQQSDSSEELQLRNRIESYQREVLEGFTSRQLADLDAISTRKLKQSTLRETSLLPILTRWEELPEPRYQRKELYALENGLEGYWTMSNPIVAKILQPSLLIANRILASMHTVPWFDALLNGERLYIRDDRYPNKYDPRTKGFLQQFKIRPQKPSNHGQALSKRDDIYEQMIENYEFKFGFQTHKEDPRSGVKGNGSYLHGATTWRSHGNQNLTLDVWITLEGVSALLNSNLTDAERMGQEWFIATSIVHESMHAMFRAKRWEDEDVYDSPTRPIAMYEPYFEDEQISELGDSMEVVVLGGPAGIMLSGVAEALASKPYFGYWLSANHPNAHSAYFGTAGGPILTSPALSDIEIKLPVRVSMFENVQQESFWELGVRSFGLRLLHEPRIAYASRSISTRDRFGPAKLTIWNTEPYIPEKAAIKDGIWLTPVEKSAIEFGNALRRSAKCEDEYWDNSMKLREQVVGIIREIDTLQSASSLETIKPITRVTSYLREARQHHEVMVRSLLETETNAGIPYTDRRSVLRRWNKGTRTFIREMRCSCERFINVLGLLDFFDAELLSLELCRMLLTDPPTGAIVVDDEETGEMKLVEAADQAMLNNDYEASLHICNQIFDNQGCSLWTTQLAHLLLSTSLPTNRSVAERLNDYKICKRILDAIRLGFEAGGFSPAWSQVLSCCIAKIDAVGRVLQAEGCAID